jgi:tRNA-splicing ligase RtcB
MACAANFAWANRQIISHIAVEAFERIFGAAAEKMGIRLLYDVCHNIAKIETHTVNGNTEKLCVHRKGATRAFPSGSEGLPAPYMETGQPVLIPGDMGSSSYICRGAERASELTFKSSCHGAGRVLSRKAAVRQCRQRNIFKELSEKGIKLIAKSGRTAAEEMPEAYKDSTRVVNVMHNLGTAVKVARLEPFGVIKG